MDEALENARNKYKDINSIFKGKDVQTIVGQTTFTRAILSDATVSLLHVCKSLFTILESKSEKDLKEGIIDACSKSLAKVLEDNLQNSFGKLMNNINNSNDLENDIDKAHAHKSKHTILVQNKENTVYNNDSWANAVKSTISTKLKSVPVSKSVITKKGEGCIILPDEESQKNAMEILKDDFNVTVSPTSPSRILPKIKVHNIDKVVKD